MNLLSIDFPFKPQRNLLIKKDFNWNQFTFNSFESTFSWFLKKRGLKKTHNRGPPPNLTIEDHDTNQRTTLFKYKYTNLISVISPPPVLRRFSQTSGTVQETCWSWPSFGSERTRFGSRPGKNCQVICLSISDLERLTDYETVNFGVLDLWNV